MGIVIADDQESACQLYKLMLSRYDCEVVGVSSGAALMEEIRRQKPDLILSDHFMPDKKGLEIARELRKNSELQSIPIILITGKDLDQSLRDQARFEINGYLPKPFTEYDLVKAIEQVLHRPLPKK